MIHIGKAGDVKCVFHRKFNGEMKAITISRKSYDFYEISILVDDTFVKAEIKKHTYEGTIGIDMGSKEGNNGGNAICQMVQGFKLSIMIKKIKRLKGLKENFPERMG